MFSEFNPKLESYAKLAFEYVLRVRDIRIAGQVLFVIIVLLVSWSGVKAINANYSLEKQIATLQAQDDVQQLENSNMALQNNYYKSNQYLELSARQNFGLAFAGEKELLVPQNVALGYTVPVPQAPTVASGAKLPWYEQNLQAWLNFFMHRKPVN